MAIHRRSAPNRSYLALAEKLLSVPDAGVDGGLRGPLPSAAEIGSLADELMTLLFPSSGRAWHPQAGPRSELREALAASLAGAQRRLEDAVYLGVHRRCRDAGGNDPCRLQARSISNKLLRALPEIRCLLVQDVEAALESDPAATGAEEIIACYPGLYAVAIYRTAHRLLQEGAGIVPRMLTEHAKSRTGIDIHPGATIGSSFFIDHGTGIVIGETTRIGRSVRIYQGVTLGALSIKRRASAAVASKRAADPVVEVESIKRHPTIEDEVIIYANATILGGDTVIGRGAVIGGNSFITYSVPPGIRVGVGR